ncbi:hypothetical protein ACS0TY_013834 [Phlomoides rotata]
MLVNSATFKITFFQNFQTGFLCLWGEKVDAIDYQTTEIERLSKELKKGRG